MVAALHDQDSEEPGFSSPVVAARDKSCESYLDLRNTQASFAWIFEAGHVNAKTCAATHHYAGHRLNVVLT